MEILRKTQPRLTFSQLAAGCLFMFPNTGAALYLKLNDNPADNLVCVKPSKPGMCMPYPGQLGYCPPGSHVEQYDITQIKEL